MVYDHKLHDQSQKNIYQVLKNSLIQQSVQMGNSIHLSVINEWIVQEYSRSLALQNIQNEREIVQQPATIKQLNKN